MPSSGPAIDLVGALFDIIDVDGGGDLDEEETKRYLKAMGVAEPELDARWQAMLEAADTDGDGTIDRSEFLTYILKDEELTADGAFANADREAELTEVIIMLQMVHLHHIGPAADLVGALFDAIDADGGGDLDEEETKGYLRVIGVAKSELDARWKAMLVAADTDGDGMLDRSEFLTYILKDEELTEDGAFANADREAELTDAIIQLQFGDETAGGVIELDTAEGKEKPSCMLHVRGVGGAFESEEALTEVFKPFGAVVQATVRHRTDAEGNNTSWALVTMSHYKGAHRALKRASELPQPLTVTRFSQKQAAASTGAMGTIRREAAAKQIQSRWRQRQARTETAMVLEVDARAGSPQTQTQTPVPSQSQSLSSPPARQPWTPVKITVNRPDVDCAQEHSEKVTSPMNAALHLDAEQHDARASRADEILNKLLSPPAGASKRPLYTHHSSALTSQTRFISAPSRTLWQGNFLVSDHDARAARASQRLVEARERAARIGPSTTSPRLAARTTSQGGGSPRSPDTTTDTEGRAYARVNYATRAYTQNLGRHMLSPSASPRQGDVGWRYAVVRDGHMPSYGHLLSPSAAPREGDVQSTIFPLSARKQAGADTPALSAMRSSSAPVSWTASTGTSGVVHKHGVRTADGQGLHSRPTTAAALSYVKLAQVPTSQRAVFNASPGSSPRRTTDARWATSTSPYAAAMQTGGAGGGSGGGDSQVASGGSRAVAPLSPFRRARSNGYGDNHKAWSPGAARWSGPGVVLFGTNKSESSDGADGAVGGAGS